MIATAAKKNPHLEKLFDLTGQGDRPIDYLIIAHDDPKLMKCLTSALADNSGTVLPIPQDEWDLSGEDLPEAIQWAIEICHVKHVVLVGSSAAELPEQGQLVLSPQGDSQTRSFLDRVKHAATDRTQLQNHFLQELVLLTALLESTNDVVGHELHVEGFFYRAESGAFVYYDQIKQSFQSVA